MTVISHSFIQPVRRALLATLFASSVAFGAEPWDMPDTHPSDVAPVQFNQLSAGYYHTLGVSTAGTVWAWGHNTYNQLGVPQAEVTGPVRVLGGLAGKKVHSALAAGYHSLALTEDGEVYAWGYTEDVFFSAAPNPKVPTQPTRVEGALRNQKVVSIGVGTYQNYAVTEAGELFRWDSDTLDANGVDLAQPRAILPGHRVVRVVGGAGLAGAIDDSGGLWIWGWGVGPSGELAQEGERKEPVQVAALSGKPVTLLAVGSEHMLAATAQGELFAWGNNWLGQLGTGQSGDGVRSPLPVALDTRVFPNRVVKLGAEANASYAVTESGQLYAWGMNFNDQLPLPPSAGDPDNYRAVNVPTQAVDAVSMSGVSDVDGGFEYGVALARDGSVLAWGENYEGLLGLGVPLSLNRVFAPTRLQPVTAPVSMLLPGPSSRLMFTYPNEWSTDTLKRLPTFYGSGLPGTAMMVTVTAGPGNSTGTVLCTATVNSSGYWNCAPSTALEPDAYYSVLAFAFVNGRPVAPNHVAFKTADY